MNSISETAVIHSLEESANLIRSLSKLESSIRGAAKQIQKALLGGHQILTCGNGGSAADSSHLATEIACRFIGDRKPFPAINLTGDGGLLTATANDYSFDEIFARQIIAYGRPGDVLVAISTSGHSPNIRRALEQARENGIDSIALLGRDGGQCKNLATTELIVEHRVTARIQEAHAVIIHLFCELIEPALRS
jgi:phosphoheptose isomerase